MNKIDKPLLELQIETLSNQLNKELTETERDHIEGLLNMLGDIADTIHEEQKVEFEYNGKKYSHKFTPTEGEYWEGFEDGGISFDINFDEESDTVYVYCVENGETLIQNTIFKQRIK